VAGRSGWSNPLDKRQRVGKGAGGRTAAIPGKCDLTPERLRADRARHQDHRPPGKKQHRLRKAISFGEIVARRLILADNGHVGVPGKLGHEFLGASDDGTPFRVDPALVAQLFDDPLQQDFLLGAPGFDPRLEPVDLGRRQQAQFGGLQPFQLRARALGDIQNGQPRVMPRGEIRGQMHAQDPRVGVIDMDQQIPKSHGHSPEYARDISCRSTNIAMAIA
jgi:hypothetical protein